MADPYAGFAGELLRRAEDETAAYQAATLRARELPWWRVRLRRQWLELAEDHRLRAITLIMESEAADA